LVFPDISEPQRFWKQVSSPLGTNSTRPAVPAKKMGRHESIDVALENWKEFEHKM
jgi:hypothetical protein